MPRQSVHFEEYRPRVFFPSGPSVCVVASRGSPQTVRCHGLMASTVMPKRFSGNLPTKASKYSPSSVKPACHAACGGKHSEPDLCLRHALPLGTCRRGRAVSRRITECRWTLLPRAPLSDH